jgi:hypothetical protein
MAVSEKSGNFPSAAADPVGDAVVAVEDAISSPLGSDSSTCESSAERSFFGTIKVYLDPKKCRPP